MGRALKSQTLIAGSIECARKRLMRLAQRNGFELRQNYNRVAPRLAIQVGRYAHARQYKRMNGSLRKLRTLVGSGVMWSVMPRA